MFINIGVHDIVYQVGTCNCFVTMPVLAIKTTKRKIDMFTNITFTKEDRGADLSCRLLVSSRKKYYLEIAVMNLHFYLALFKDLVFRCFHFINYLNKCYSRRVAAIVATAGFYRHRDPTGNKSSDFVGYPSTHGAE